MGFWHTGYMDFHEQTGLDEPVTDELHCGTRSGWRASVSFNSFTSPLRRFMDISAQATTARVSFASTNVNLSWCLIGEAEH